MGERAASSGGVGTADQPLDPALTAPSRVPANGASEPAPGDTDESSGRDSFDVGRRRFTIASVVAVLVTAVPLLWIFWTLPQTASADSGPIHENNYYELQARAIFHGHLWVPPGALGIEAFVHGGRQYTYFGLFPSLLRMPILLVTSSLDGKLTPAFITLAWLVTALFGAMVLWRVRILLRGPAVMGWSEAVSYGLVMATLMGGTVFMLLAAEPDVFEEDLAWSICLTVASMFALLGVLERPSWPRVALTFAFVLAANLDRVTTGWACVGAVVLVAGWFALGRGGPENRRWIWPILGAGLVPLLVGCAVNYAKFGVPFGVSNFDQVFTQVNAYRRKFLAANHDSEAGITFIPSTVLAYMRPDGIRFTDVFPYITLPSAPPAAIGGVLFDRRYRTASLPASMPLLFLLSIWGVITAYRPRALGRVALTRIPLLAMVLAGAALFGWGYIAPRYLADFVPFLVLGSAVAMADIWRRLHGAARNRRVLCVAVIGVLAVFGVYANTAMAITPSEEWDTNEVLRYVQNQKALSDETGHPIESQVTRGTSLPAWAPADQLFIVGKCDGLYISNGENFATVPAQQFQRDTWMAVERGHRFQHTYSVTFRRPPDGSTPAQELLRAGTNSIWMSVGPTSDPHRLQVLISRRGATVSTVYGVSGYVAPGSTHQVVVVTDPAKRLVSATLSGQELMTATLVGGNPIVALGASQLTAAEPYLTIEDKTASTPQPTLCRSLAG